MWVTDLAVSTLLASAACSIEPSPDSADAAGDTAAAATAGLSPAPEQDAFWAALQAHCGNACRGRVSDATPHYSSSLTGDAVMHVPECSEDRIHIPFDFWFFDFVNDATLQYGVHWPKFGHSVRFEFDLATAVEPPPRPWGY